MNEVTVGIIGLAILFFLLSLKLPIGASLGIVGLGGLWYLKSADVAISKLALTSWEVVANYDLAVLPLFVLMAHIVFVTGLGQDLYTLAAKWLGRLPGGLAIATQGGCAGFAAVSASSVATAVTIGTVALPEMKRYKYDPALSVGAIAAGGTIGILIPPSGMLILYGILTETSIGKLFLAGFIPGILQAVFYMTAIYILCKRNPLLGPKGPSYTLREKLGAVRDCLEVIALVVFVLAGLMLGWFTATEAGAAGAFGAVIVSMLRRRLDWTKFKAALYETMKTSGMLYGILVGAYIFKYFIAVSTLPMMLTEFIGSLAWPPMAIMLCIIVLYIVLGTAMEEMSMMLLTIPILFPLVFALGFDAIWFGIIIVRMMQIAMISPPLGINMFVIQKVAAVPIGTVYRGVIPFLYADVVHVAMLLAFPAVVLFLPALAR